VVGGSEFAARVYAAINARDREAITALSAPDIVVATTVDDAVRYAHVTS
jgi:hypothetical protein